MSGENPTAEQRQSAAKMIADAEQLRADAELLESCEAETRSSHTVPRGPVATAETRSREERNIATNKALRAYAEGKTFESRDLTVAGDGAFIPTGVANPVIAKKSAGNVYDVVGKLSTSTGNPINLPLINDTTNGFVLIANSITTTDPVVSSATIGIDDYRSNPILLDNSLLQDSAIDVLSLIQEAEQSRYQRTIANAITAGNGSQISALTSVSTHVTTAANTAIAYGDLTSVLGTLDPSYTSGACWLMSTGTLTGQIMQIKDSNNRPIFLNFMDGGESGFAGTLFGFPVKINPYQPAFAAAASAVVQFGNFAQGYTLREVQPGIVIKVLRERYAELNRLGVVSFVRAAGVLTDAGTHPIVSLNVHA
jgi:HK97 family phage major capsid protein